MKQAVFLDRDGTIIEEKNFLSSPDGVVLIKGAVEAIRQLAEAGFLIIVVTNQSGIARGMFTRSEAEAVNRRVLELLNQEGAHVDAVYYCPHHPEGTVARYAVHCQCRKPEPGMGLRAAAEYGIDLTHSYMIGDKPIDIAFGRNCGMKKSFLVQTGYGRMSKGLENCGEIVEDIFQAAERIIEERKR